MMLPEELLERILEQAIPAPRPHWLSSPPRLAPLSVSRKFNRIATPLLYHSIHLPTPSSARLLQDTLQHRPEYAHYIRALTVLGVWAPVVDVLALCRGLSSLDLTIAFDEEVVDLDVLQTLGSMRHLTLRKPNNVYLSLARPRALINSLAHAITSWSDLRTANIAFKLSDDTPTSPIASFSPFSSFSPAPHGPIAALASALASAPALHSFSTHLPSVWNAAIAAIASNPALHRICLTTNSPSSPAIPGTGLFLMEARRHPRLAELITAGTPIIRSRAHTLGAPPPPAPPSPKPSIGLGLRIDTSEHAIHGPSGLAPVYQSPVPSSAAVCAINPAWMGVSRCASQSRSTKPKRKARARRG
ncbi:hypothetical protein C0995_012301 [Termitomyces sp. Mi166|nr:hypothetical protein C0995_012301 [Termitomyces sp. Mi166\